MRLPQWCTVRLNRVVDILEAFTLKIGVIGTLPTAGETYRGGLLRKAPGGGTADSLHFCRRNSGGTTAWVELVNSTDGYTHTHLLAAGATDVTASAAEVNILDGATLTTTELNYVDGVTSAVQTQIDGKLSLTGGTLTGNLEIDKSAPNLTIDATGANTQGQISFQTSGVGKWSIYKSTSASGNHLRIFDEANAADTIWVDAGGGFAIRDGITAPTAASGRAYIFVDTADGDLKVRFGDGTTKTLATDT